jgi:hypothetical protein
MTTWAGRPNTVTLSPDSCTAIARPTLCASGIVVNSRQRKARSVPAQAATQ